MVALARELGAACRISVARLRPAESDVRGMSWTRSKTTGAVRQVRGDAEVGFWVVCWVARGGARQLAAAGSGGKSAKGVEGRYTGSLRGQGVCGDCFDPFTHQERLLTARMVVLALLRRLGFWAPLEAHHANLPRLAQARSLGAIASALTPMLATPPSSVFAATGVLVLVVLLHTPNRGAE